MECRDCMQKLTEYLAGMLKNDELIAVEQHLEYCPHCQGEIKELQEVDSLINAADISIPDIDLTESIMNKIRLEAQTDNTIIVMEPSSIRITGRYRDKRLFSVLQDLVAAAAAAIIIFWYSGLVLSPDNVPNNTPNYAQGVVMVSDTVGGAFHTYLNLPVTTLEKLSVSIQKINLKQ